MRLPFLLHNEKQDRLELQPVQQIDQMTINRIATVLVEIYMNSLENNIINKIKYKHYTELWESYVDDISVTHIHGLELIKQLDQFLTKCLNNT